MSNFVKVILEVVHCRGVDGRVPVFQSSVPDSISGGSEILIYILRLGECRLCTVLC